MSETKITFRGKTESEQVSDRGGWLQTGSRAGWCSYYFRWADCPGLPRNLLPNTPVEFELSEHRGRPVAINVRRIVRGNHA